MAKTDQPDDLKYAESHEWVRVDGDEDRKSTRLNSSHP